MSRAGGTSIASPGSRKARCMSTTSSAVLPGWSFSASSNASARSIRWWSAQRSTQPSARLRLRLERSTQPSARLRLRLERSTQPSARLRLRLERSTQPSARLRLRLERSTQPSARLRLRLELPRRHGKRVRDVTNRLDPAFVVDHDRHDVEAAGLLAQALGPEIALRE